MINKCINEKIKDWLCLLLIIAFAFFLIVIIISFLYDLTFCSSLIIVVDVLFDVDTQIKQDANIPQLLLYIIAVLKFFVWAGLSGSVFSLIYDYRDRRKIKQQVGNAESALNKAFFRTFAKTTHTRWRYAPWYKSVVSIETKYSISHDILTMAVNNCKGYRFANMATTYRPGKNVFDRIVVEKYYQNTDYGCCIKQSKESNVTIVVPSIELGMSRFGFYLAKMGGFNFVSKEIESDTNAPTSFFNVNCCDDAHFKKFCNDIIRVTPEGGWIILISAMARDDAKVIGVVSKDKNEQYVSINDFNTFAKVKAEILAIDNINVEVENKEYPMTDNNLLHKFEHRNGFVLRVSYDTCLRNDLKMDLIMKLALAIKKSIVGESYISDSCKVEMQSQGCFYDGYSELN